jgi:G:T/U-mismatch repair DNA glycosylase
LLIKAALSLKQQPFRINSVFFSKKNTKYYKKTLILPAIVMAVTTSVSPSGNILPVLRKNVHRHAALCVVDAEIRFKPIN